MSSKTVQVECISACWYRPPGADPEKTRRYKVRPARRPNDTGDIVEVEADDPRLTGKGPDGKDVRVCFRRVNQGGGAPAKGGGKEAS